MWWAGTPVLHRLFFPNISLGLVALGGITVFSHLTVATARSSLQGSDDLQGDDGNDDLQGDQGDDTLDGGSGDDNEDGGGGDDSAVCSSTQTDDDNCQGDENQQ